MPELDGDTEGLPDTVVVTDVDTDALPVTDVVELPETDAVEDSVAKLERVAPPIGDAVTQLELEVVGDTEREGTDEGVCDAVPHIVIEPAEVAEEEGVIVPLAVAGAVGVATCDPDVEVSALGVAVSRMVAVPLGDSVGKSAVDEGHMVLEGDAEGDTVVVPFTIEVAEARGVGLTSGVLDPSGVPVSKKLVGEAVAEGVSGAVAVGEDVTDAVAEGVGGEEAEAEGDLVGTLVGVPRAVTDAEGVDVYVLSAVAVPVDVQAGVLVSVVRMLPEGVPPVADVVEEGVPDVLAEPVALQLSTPLKVAPEVRDTLEETLTDDVLETVKDSVPEAELVEQGDDVAERDHVLVSDELLDAEDCAVTLAEREATELFVGAGDADTSPVLVREPVAEDVGHTDTEDVGEGEVDIVGEPVAAEVAVMASTEGEGEARVVGESEKLPVTVAVTASQPVGLTVADAEPEALPVVDSEATAVKLTVPLLTVVALMDGLVRTEAQAVLVAEADRVRTPTVAEGQREGEPVPVKETAPVREAELSGELDREGDPVCDTEGCGDSENVVVVDTEEVADAVSEGELEAEEEGVRVITGVSV